MRAVPCLAVAVATSKVRWVLVLALKSMHYLLNSGISLFACVLLLSHFSLSISMLLSALDFSLPSFDSTHT